MNTFRMAVLSLAELEASTHKAGNMLEEDMDYQWEELFQDNIQWELEELNQQLAASFGDHLGAQASFYCPDYKVIF